jgi:hypothetical protein
MRRLQQWCALGLVVFSSVGWAAQPPTQPQSQQPPQPLLAEAGAGGEVVLTGVAQETVEFKLTVLNQSKDPLRGVVARLTDFRNAQFEVFTPSIDNSAQQTPAFDIAAFKPRELRVQVKLPKPGEYSARFALVANNKLYPSVVKITRVAPPLPTLEIGDPQPVLLKVPFFPSLSASRTDERKIRIRETAGVDATLAPPELQSLTYKPKDTVAFAVPATIVTTTENTVIAAGKSAEVAVAIADIPRAGRYDATIRFAAAGVTPITKTLPIVARQDWWVAAFFITLGVLLALLLRVYLGVLQPRLALQSRVALLFQQLHELAIEAGDDPDARQAVQRLRDALTAKWDALSGSAKLIGSTDFDVFEAKLPLLQNWVRLKKALPKVLPDSVRSVATATMAAALQVIEDPTATAATIETQLGKLGTLPVQIETAAQAAAQTALNKLKADFQASSDPDVQALQPQLQALLADFADTTLPLDAKFTKLNALRRKYVTVLSRSLLQQLNTKPPFDMDASVWSAARERAKVLLLALETTPDADAAVATYLEAVSSWLRPQLSAFAIDLRKKAAVGTVQQESFLKLKDKVEALLTDVDAGKLEGALARVTPLLDDYKQLLAAANSTLGPAEAAGLKGLADAMKTAPALAGIDVLRYFGSVPSSQQLSRRGARAASSSKERLISFIAVAIILALAVLVGVKALWAEDWTWGGGTAYLVAFLWGAGLSSFSYDGVTGLLKRFASS